MAFKLPHTIFPGIIQGIRPAVFGIERQRGKCRLLQIITQPAYPFVKNDIDRSAHGEGCHRNPAGKRLKQYQPKGVGQAGEHKHIRVRHVLRHFLAKFIADETGCGIFMLQLLALRAVANDVLGAR